MITKRELREVQLPFLLFCAWSLVIDRQFTTDILFNPIGDLFLIF
jgi:hypothetical protein